MKKIELLAPAKDKLSAFAAVDYGADALYIGGASFGARRAASNSLEDIERVVEYAHRYGVKVHATFNTLIFEHEMEQAQAAARALVATGVDALIVQDMAVARMGLDVELHASTQMCNMTAQGVGFLQECGFSRVVLERALSLEKIRSIAKATDVELEAFVHGAICVGYSGRCFLSRSMSERSGNRGACSQSCRMTYDLVSGSGERLIESKHLLSVRDLNLSARIGEMLDAGVTSFKVEGRLKEIGYTKNIISYYRTALDRELANRADMERSSWGESSIDFTPNPSKSFTRGESEYLFDGQRRALASFETPKALGESVGQILDVRGSSIRVSLRDGFAAGDGICCVGRDGVVGTNVNSVRGEWLELNRVDGMHRGGELYRNYDKRFNDILERGRVRRAISAQAEIEMGANSVSVSYCDERGCRVKVQREMALEVARDGERQRQAIEQQLVKSGDTIFNIKSVDVLSDIYFVPSSVLAQLRREALAELEAEGVKAMPKPRIFSENMDARYPLDDISSEENVVNSLSEAFYRDHGVKQIARGWDMADTLRGARVLQSGYCLRREIGECLKEGSSLRDELYLEHGRFRYRLEFDCQRCQMNLIDEN